MENRIFHDLPGTVAHPFLKIEQSILLFLWTPSRCAAPPNSSTYYNNILLYKGEWLSEMWRTERIGIRRGPFHGINMQMASMGFTRNLFNSIISTNLFIHVIYCDNTIVIKNLKYAKYQLLCPQNA